jgi:N-acetylglucosamine-6-phosphate deacetylase
MLQATPADAIAMASATPAAFLGLANVTGRIATGLRADLALLDDDGQATATWIAGVEARPTH